MFLKVKWLRKCDCVLFCFQQPLQPPESHQRSLNGGRCHVSVSLSVLVLLGTKTVSKIWNRFRTAYAIWNRLELVPNAEPIGEQLQNSKPNPKFGFNSKTGFKPVLEPVLQLSPRLVNNSRIGFKTWGTLEPVLKYGIDFGTSFKILNLFWGKYLEPVSKFGIYTRTVSKTRNLFCNQLKTWNWVRNWFKKLKLILESIPKLVTNSGTVFKILNYFQKLGQV